MRKMNEKKKTESQKKYYHATKCKGAEELVELEKNTGEDRYGYSQIWKPKRGGRGVRRGQTSINIGAQRKKVLAERVTPQGSQGAP